MPDGYLILDQDGRIVDSNGVARRLLTAAVSTLDDPADVVGIDAEDLTEDISFVEGDQAPLDEGQFVVSDREEQRYIDLQSTVLEDDGFFIGRLVTLRDVTKKVQAESQLRRERREFETLFSHMNDPVAKIRFEDGSPIVAATNPAFATTFGVDRETVEGEVIHDLIVPEEELASAVDLVQKIHAGRAVKREVRRQTDNGIRDFLLRSAPVEEVGDRTTYLIYTDITVEKRRQRELEKKNRRLDQFASIVSHDLRNPLNVAQGLLEAAESGETSGETLEELRRSLDRMEAMIEDVLTLARQGEKVGNPDPVRLGEVADTAWETVDTRSATLSVVDEVTLRADPDRLLQLFENLYRNAIDHAGPDVTITVGSIDGDQTGFYVADDGPGIPEDRRDGVFDHGFTTTAGGTGFGLSIVDQIARAHGWSTDITESAAGGARIEITGTLRPHRSDADPGSDRVTGT